MSLFWSRLTLVTTMALIVIHQLPHIKALRLGVNYGQNGDNLPAASDVIGLYKKCGIKMIRLFEPIPEILEALKGTDIRVSLGIRNEKVQTLASSIEEARSWVSTTFVPVKDLLVFWITVGNEVIPGPEASYVPQAMRNINQALNEQSFLGINITTVVAGNALQTSYPPSAGAFTDDVNGVMSEIVKFLAQIPAPLMINVYPYFAYASSPSDIPLQYALSNTTDPVVDGDLKYYSLFDAMVDSFIAALEKVGGENIGVAVSETGWPTAGNEPYTSVANAQAYVTNLNNHLLQGGTPRRPDSNMDVFLFEMFNEDEKPSGVEQNFGMFNPTNLQPIYPFWQSCLSK